MYNRFFLCFCNKMKVKRVDVGLLSPCQGATKELPSPYKAPIMFNKLIISPINCNSTIHLYSLRYANKLLPLCRCWGEIRQQLEAFGFLYLKIANLTNNEKEAYRLLIVYPNSIYRLSLGYGLFR